MKRKIIISTVGLLTAVVVPVSALGLANAATATNSSTIPKSVYKTERTAAVSQVLNTSTANVQTALKAKTLKQLISDAGLTRQTFTAKMKIQLTTDLEAKGYTQAEITAAMQQHRVHHLHHKLQNARAVKKAK